jgi:hypothetical protein
VRCDLQLFVLVGLDVNFWSGLKVNLFAEALRRKFEDDVGVLADAFQTGRILTELEAMEKEVEYKEVLGAACDNPRGQRERSLI